MFLGYARVSTDDQVMDLQRDALVKAGVDPGQVYEEQVSGVKTKRPQLDACLKSLRKGDTLIVWRLDRLGRSVPELIAILEDLDVRGVGFRSLTESIDTTTAAGKMIFHMLAAFAEFERNLISERTKAGLKAARARGHRGGRRSKVRPRMLTAIKTMLEDPTCTMAEVADNFKVSRASIYRALQRDAEEQKAKELAKFKT
ncbi:hypothetical protein LCGC14_0354990 [marine sediment metagenome]|uniref:Resolvase/invertase-type recombinase catalytic domain-containing protein n=1 Tax=marine sediment metagenome TaxID=412755 RepID=A0A0F9TFA4_9ZZZZ